ncbi:MAG: hypothetical protein AAGC85_08940 [Bacteroidota bacterium]
MRIYHLLLLFILLGSSLQAQRHLQGGQFMEANGTVIFKDLRGYSLGMGYGYHLSQKWSFRLLGNYEFYGYEQESPHFIYTRVSNTQLDTIGITVPEEAMYESFFLDGIFMFNLATDGSWFLNANMGLKVGLEELNGLAEDSQRELQAGISLGLEAEFYFLDQFSFFGYGREDLWLNDGLRDLPKLGIGFRIHLN